MERQKQELEKGRFFDEQRAFYDMRKRNALLFAAKENPKDIVRQHLVEQRKQKFLILQIKERMMKALNELIPNEDIKDLLHDIDTLKFEKVLMGLIQSKQIAKESKRKDKIEQIDDLIQRIKDYLLENQKY